MAGDGAQGGVGGRGFGPLDKRGCGGMGPRIREDKGEGCFHGGRLYAGITGESRGRRERVIRCCSAAPCAIADTRWERPRAICCPSPAEGAWL